MNPLKPALKWAGGKTHLVPQLRELYMPFRECRLVEPFAGGLAVSLGLMPESALLNDVNPHVVNFYQQLCRGLTIESEMENDADCFYRARERFNQLLQADSPCGVEQAGLFYYLNRTGFNGLCRFNSKGRFNVPFGRYKAIRYRREFAEYAPVLSNWEFRCGDFAALKLRPDDFLYLDPPYDTPFTRYAQDDFTWGDQVRLAEWGAKHRGVVIASNQATARIVELYGDLGYDMEAFSAPRRIACNGNRTPALEILATRNLYKPPVACC